MDKSITLAAGMFSSDHHERLAALRTCDPVHWYPALESWVLTRHADVRSAFSDERLEPPRRMPVDVRRLISSWFASPTVARMEGQVRDVVAAASSRIVRRSGRVDLIKVLIDPVPNAVIARIVGFSSLPGGEEQFRSIAGDLMKFIHFGGSPEELRRGERAFHSLSDWVKELVADRRRRPGDDLVSDLLATQGDRVDEQNLVVLIVGLIGAGSETTSMGAAYSLKQILERREVYSQIRADRSMLSSAVKESLRLEIGNAACGPSRFAAEDLSLHGKKIRKGQRLMLSTSSANRDEAVFSDPNVFRLDRDNREILTFGHGRQFCLGASLAMLEIQCIVDAALEILPDEVNLRPDGVLIRWHGLLQRIERLEVDLLGG